MPHTKPLMLKGNRQSSDERVDDAWMLRLLGMLTGLIAIGITTYAMLAG